MSDVSTATLSEVDDREATWLVAGANAVAVARRPLMRRGRRDMVKEERKKRVVVEECADENYELIVIVEELGDS